MQQLQLLISCNDLRFVSFELFNMVNVQRLYHFNLCCKCFSSFKVYEGNTDKLSGTNISLSCDKLLLLKNLLCLHRIEFLLYYSRKILFKVLFIISTMVNVVKIGGD